MPLRFSFKEGLRIEKRSIDKMKLWGQGADNIGTESFSGMNVSQSNALRLITVYACVRLLSGAIAGLPVDIFRKRGEDSEPVARPPLWLEMPNPETTWFEFCERIMSSLLLDGNAFILITARDSLGFPSELWTLHPRNVDVRWGVPTLTFQPSIIRSGQTFFVWGGDRVLRRFGPTNPSGDLLHIKAFNDGGMRGLSPIELARQGIGLGLVTEKFGAKFFGTGSQVAYAIEMPPNTPALSREHIELMRETWEAAHSGSDRAHRPAILTQGATLKSITIPPEDAQFLETRKFQVAEIARLFCVPPHLVGDVERSTSWGTGIEQQSIGFVTYSLMPWLIRLEQTISQLTPRGQFIKFNFKGLLRADAVAEAEAFGKAVQNGWMNQEEVRRKLDLPTVPGLDRFWMPSNFQPVTGNPQSPPVAQPTQDGEPNAGAA